MFTFWNKYKIGFSEPIEILWDWQPDFEKLKGSFIPICIHGVYNFLSFAHIDASLFCWVRGLISLQRGQGMYHAEFLA